MATNPVLDDLATLIGFPTVSNRPVDDLASFVAQRSEDLGFRIERFKDPHQKGKYNLVTSIGPQDSNGLVLSGHMDVVPTEGQPWDSDPFTLTEREGRLVGRGTADMKGFIAATLQALARVPLEKLTHELVCVWTYDEEVGCLGSGRLAADLKARNRSLPKACLIGEPTGFEILRMHPGHTAVEILIEGQAAHSSRPDLGRNAIETGAVLVEKLQEFAALLATEPTHTEHFKQPYVVLNTATIEGGRAVNIVPDWCRIQVGFRPMPGQCGEEIAHRLEAFLRQRSPRTRCAFSVGVTRSTPPLLTEDNSPLHHSLCEHAAHPKAGSATFATDGSHLALLGCAPLIFGPGSITVAHMANEYIEGADLIAAIDVIESVVHKHCLVS
jgi:acetylornithine deacetylase